MPGRCPVRLLFRCLRVLRPARHCPALLHGPGIAREYPEPPAVMVMVVMVMVMMVMVTVMMVTVTMVMVTVMMVMMMTVMMPMMVTMVMVVIVVMAMMVVVKVVMVMMVAVTVVMVTVMMVVMAMMVMVTVVMVMVMTYHRTDLRRACPGSCNAPLLDVASTASLLRDGGRGDALTRAVVCGRGL